MRRIVAAVLLIVWLVPSFVYAADDDVPYRIVQGLGLQGQDEELRIRLEGDSPTLSLNHVKGRGVAVGAGVIVSSAYVERLCSAPCEVVVPRFGSSEFFLGGKDIPATEAFDLSEYRGSVTIKGKKGSLGLTRTGTTSIAVGMLGMIGGGAAVLTGSLLPDYSRDDRQQAASYRTIGLVAAGSGVALLVTGLILRNAGATKYELTSGIDSNAPQRPAAPGTQSL